MNIQKENICVNKVKTKNIYQITMDNDYIISDVKPDIKKLIREQGEVLIDECKVHTDKIEIKGRVRVVLLYISADENNMINSIIQYMAFSESINMPGVDARNEVSVKGEIEDITVNIINSRKISIKAIVNFNSIVYENVCHEVVTDINDNESVMKLSKDVNLSRLVINKKDIYRVKDEVILQSSKKDISEILYYDVHMPRCNTRLGDGVVGLRGDVVVFVLYLTEDGEYECLEKEITYNGEIELYEVKENMLDDICVGIIDKEISVKPDEDGERRIIDIDVTLNLDIKCYNDETIEILADAYSLNCDLDLQKENVEYETVLLKNNTTFKVEDTIEIKKDTYDVLQVCNSTATVKIDEVSIGDSGIDIEGVVEINIIYISNKDNCPINSVKEMVPFNHLIEIDGITKESKYSIKPYVEQVNVVMSSGSTFEVKVAINMDTIVFLANSEMVVKDIIEHMIDKKDWNNRASMTGYIVKENDNLWDIAKKFYTTVDMLKKTNKIVDKDIEKGDKMLIIKSRL